jgi:hypothetical protein
VAGTASWKGDYLAQTVSSLLSRASTQARREPSDLRNPANEVSETIQNALQLPFDASGGSQAARTNVTRPVSTLAPTAASTLLFPNARVEVVELPDDQSQTSYALSSGGEHEEDQLRLPRLSEVLQGLVRARDNTSPCSMALSFLQSRRLSVSPRL